VNKKKISLSYNGLRFSAIYIKIYKEEKNPHPRHTIRSFVAVENYVSDRQKKKGDV